MKAGMAAVASRRTGPAVIGAGFGRTGTMSLKRALEILGFGPCHHMEEVVWHPEEVPTWEAAARGEDVDWATFMRPWGACVDFPSALHYQALADTFSDARVILGVRDPDRWYASFASTILPLTTRFPTRLIGPWLPFLGGLFRSTRPLLLEGVLGGGALTDREHVIRAYNAHNEAVRRKIPPHRLLVFEVQDGWEPLCAFLGVPVPDVPFPRVNDTPEFQRRARLITAACWLALLVPPLLAVAAPTSWLLRRRGPVRPHARRTTAPSRTETT